MRFSVSRSLCRCYRYTVPNKSVYVRVRIGRDRINCLCVKHTVWVQSPGRARALLTLPSSYLEVLLCHTRSNTSVQQPGTEPWLGHTYTFAQVDHTHTYKGKHSYRCTVIHLRTQYRHIRKYIYAVIHT